MEPQEMEETIEIIEIGTPQAPEAEVENRKPLTIVQAIICNAVIIAAAIIIGSFIISHGSFGPSTATGGSATTADTAVVPPDINKVNLAGAPFIGNAKASVVLAYWSDYQCPFCKQFEITTFQNIVKDYVATGKVAVVFKDFSFLGSDSTTAALYARAIWQLYPQQYFTWRTAMFTSQDGENTGFGDEASIVKLTGTITGIDTGKVTAAVAANKDVYQKTIDADRDEAISFGIKGTPSFMTGTTLIKGVTPYDTFKKDFDAQLK
jgi:protein-disulfide isomerase